MAENQKLSSALRFDVKDIAKWNADRTVYEAVRYETAGGGIALTIRIPHIGRTGGNAEDNGGSEPYLVLSAEGGSYAQALTKKGYAVRAIRNLDFSPLPIIGILETPAAICSQNQSRCS